MADLLSTYKLPRFGTEDEQQRVYLTKVLGNVHDVLSQVTASSVTSVTASAPLVSSGGAAPNISIPKSTGFVDGYLSSADWNTFNSKLSSNQPITLSGDATGSGATSIAVTLANSGVGVGTYGDSTHIGSFTVDAKGRITSASSTAISFPSNSATATALQTGRTFSLTGDATGTSATFDGTANASIPVTLVNFGASGASHKHGAVPDPGAVSGTTKFLREDATWAVPPSSGGLTNWTEAGFTASPNNTVGASSFTPVSTLANADAALTPKGTGALLAQVADGTVSGGNKRGQLAVDWQMQRSLVTQVASGGFSTIGGGYSNTVSGFSSVICGGEHNSITSSAYNSVISGGGSNFTASYKSSIGGGQYNNIASQSSGSVIGGGVSCNVKTYSSGAVISGGSYNVVSGAGSAISGGAHNYAKSFGTVCGGTLNKARGNYSSCVGGKDNIADGIAAITICGNSNLADGDYSIASGAAAVTRQRRGSFAMSSGNISTQGDSQHSTFSLNAVTTSATAVQMSALPGGSALPANQLALPTGGCATFTGLIVAKDMAAGGTDCSHWSFAGGINNLNGITTLTGAVTPTLIAQTTGASAWAVTITADNTNKTLKVSVSGDAGKTLHWSCFIRDVEVV